jgi:hypothetical protein
MLHARSYLHLNEQPFAVMPRHRKALAVMYHGLTSMRLGTACPAYGQKRKNP